MAEDRFRVDCSPTGSLPRSFNQERLRAFHSSLIQSGVPRPWILDVVFG